jgi:hypothetical protein
MFIDDAAKRDELLKAYLAYQKALQQDVEDHSRFWAVEAMWDLVEWEPDGAWTFLLEMIERAEGEHALASIAAGPLENFLVTHGERFIERVEAEAARNPKFRRTLVGVWGENRMSDALNRRLTALLRDEPPL